MDKKVCVVGAGYWGSKHISILSEMGALKGIIEPNMEVLQLHLKDYPEIKGFSNVEEALTHNYDGFVIASPAETHFPIAKKLILSKKHVLIEKPMCLNVKEAEEIVLLAKKQKINVMVGHVLLFHPAINKIKYIIKNGLIGDLQYVYSNRLNLGKVRTEENVFWSLAPHDIAIFQYLTDSFPKNINSKGSTFLQKGVPDSTVTQIEYQSGVKGHIFVSWLHPFKEHRLVIIGSEAMISFEDSVKGRPLKLYSKKFNFNKGIPEKIDGPVENITYEKVMPLSLEIKHFLNHLDGKKLNFSDALHGLEVVKVLSEAGKQLLK